MIDRVEGEARGTPPAPTGRRRPVRTGLLVAIGVLYLASVPWYRETGGTIDIVFGLPDWVAVALGCYVGVAILNAVAWWLTDIPDVDEEFDRGSE